MAACILNFDTQMEVTCQLYTLAGLSQERTHGAQWFQVYSNRHTLQCQTFKFTAL